MSYRMNLQNSLDITRLYVIVMRLILLCILFVEMVCGFSPYSLRNTVQNTVCRTMTTLRDCNIEQCSMRGYYFIYKLLEIQHVEGRCYIEISCNRENCVKPYYLSKAESVSDECSDECELSELSEYAIRIKPVEFITNDNFNCHSLKTATRPIVIYENGCYVEDRFREKYETFIDEYIRENKHNVIACESYDLKNSEYLRSWRDIGPTLKSVKHIIQILKIESRVRG